MRDLNKPIAIDNVFLDYTLRFPGEPEPIHPDEKSEFESIYDDDDVFLEDGGGFSHEELYGNSASAASNTSGSAAQQGSGLQNNAGTFSFEELYGNSASPATASTGSGGTTTIGGGVQDSKFLNFVYDLVKAPFLFFYDVLMDSRKRNKADFQHFLQILFQVSCVILAITVITYIFVPYLRAPFIELFSITVVLGGSSKFLLWRKYNMTAKQVEQQRTKEKIEWQVEEEDDEIEQDDDDIVEESEDDFIEEDDDIVEEDDESFIEEEEEDDWIAAAPARKQDRGHQKHPLKRVWSAPPPLQTTGGKLNLKIVNNVDDEQFRDILVDSFLKTRRKYGSIDFMGGSQIPSRAQLLKSFSELIYANTPGFSEWNDLTSRSTVSVNLCYLIYEGLREEFKLDYLEDPFKVISIRENELMYRIEAVCSKRVRKEAENSGERIAVQFRADEKSTPIVQVRSMGTGRFIFKVMKPIRRIVSLGDVLEYKDEETGFDLLTELSREDYHLPFLVGLVNNEIPVAIDLSDQTHLAIVGESGGGKSWFVFYLIMSLVLTNQPSDVSFLLLDRKGSPIFHSLSRFPHVIHLENNIANYINILNMVSEELALRKEILKKFDSENWNVLREKFQDRPKILRNFPYLYVVVEEMATTLNALLDLDKAKVHDVFVGKTSELAREARGLGIRLISISQRTTADNIPKSVFTQSGFKVGFNLMEADYERIDMKKGSSINSGQPGQALMSNKDLGQYAVLVRTLGTGAVGKGKNSDNQVIELMKILAMEWNLRNPYLPVFKSLTTIDSRQKRREGILNDYEIGNYFSTPNQTEEEILAEVLGIEVEGTESRSISKTVDEGLEIRYRDQEKFQRFTNKRFGTQQRQVIAETEDEEVYDYEEDLEEEEEDIINDDEIIDEDDDSFIEDDDIIEEDDDFIEEDDEIIDDDVDDEIEEGEEEGDVGSLLEIVEGNRDNVSRKSPNWGVRKFTGPQAQGNTSATKVIEKPDISLIDYIKEKGGRVLVSEIKQLYRDEDIKYALIDSQIVESGDGKYYMV